MFVCVSVVWEYLFEELSIDSSLQEGAHGAGAVGHETLLTECDWFTLHINSKKERMKGSGVDNYI